MSRRRSRRTTSTVAHRWIDDDAAFADVVDALAGVDRYGVDTEFHRERTYFAHLALLQLSWDGDLVLVDPLAVDLTPLAAVLDSDALAIMHAGQQDLEVLEQACGAVPRKLFDTQIAAGFVGYATPSLTKLCEGELGVRIPKGDRLTDWLRRPLGEAQRSYAASDVAHLLDLHDRLTAELAHLGRTAWVDAEGQALLDRPRGGLDPDLAWQRVKEVRHLRGTARSIARSVAAWRERTAAETDQPVRFVLSDLALVSVAQAAPADEDALRKLRGVDGRHLRNGAAAGILRAVAEGADPATAPTDDRSTPPPAGLDPSLRPAVTLVSAWVAQVARDERFDPSLLGTRADIEGFLRADGTSRIDHGWRHELLGGPIRDLVEGRAALAFDGAQGLLLEARGGHADVSGEAE
ncbi:MAG: HRDC domain-containing protein [Actinomycetota bacterium]